MRAFVGKNADYYINKWQNAKDPAKRSGWNWAGFLAGIFWLGYRKMYKILLAVLGLFLLIDFIQYFTSFDIYAQVGLGVSGVLGIIGNSVYYNHMNRRIKELSKNCGNDDELKELARAVGGATWKGVGITLLLFAAYIIAFTILDSIMGMLFHASDLNIL
jgi:hypothetical protein